MNSELAFDLFGGFLLVLVACGIGLSSCLGVRAGRDMFLDPERTAAENDKCSLQGGVLLCGQLGEFVCVKPGSEKWRRKP